jgi:hypothetical protein
VRWVAPAGTSRAELSLLETVTVPETPDDPLAPIPAATVKCSRFYASSSAEARSWKIVAVRVGALG